MREGERFGRTFGNVEKQSDISVAFHDGVWSLSLPYDRKIKLPERLGKVLSLGLAIGEKAFNNRSKASLERLEKFDCHHLVTLALGMRTVPDVVDMGRYSQERIFDANAYVHIENVDMFETLARTKMGEEHIGIFQISDGKSLTHSSFLFIAEETLYVAAKSGFQGLLFIEKSSDIMDTYLKVYGQHVAVDSYNTIFKKFHSGEKK